MPWPSCPMATEPVPEMTRIPGALFVIDPSKERNALAEARRVGVPIVAIVDTNCDPDEVDYPIPGNDDAIRAVALFCAVIADAVIQGKQTREAVAEKIAGEAKEAEVAAPVAQGANVEPGKTKASSVAKEG